MSAAKLLKEKESYEKLRSELLRSPKVNELQYAIITSDIDKKLGLHRLNGYVKGSGYLSASPTVEEMILAF